MKNKEGYELPIKEVNWLFKLKEWNYFYYSNKKSKKQLIQMESVPRMDCLESLGQQMAPSEIDQLKGVDQEEWEWKDSNVCGKGEET